MTCVCVCLHAHARVLMGDGEREGGRESTLSGVSSWKDTNPVMRAPLLWPHLNLITTQESHLQIPSQWELGLQHVNWEGAQKPSPWQAWTTCPGSNPSFATYSNLITVLTFFLSKTGKIMLTSWGYHEALGFNQCKALFKTCLAHGTYTSYL